ncbi:hypothetical protein B0T26DRAFT_867765 [Lasiosphaeria miniovina]|uniref:Secreted protein n=1 Tax=Lasiosphaeria miniovina TaxID=1954250 RepID=A0AA40BID9_9PEZI|nr:uncharacterized protein B0T26DRAFT_867765 [Lasiosphaeria miniovina]KAK0734801.1 hypothetical protein B0T26DRAFT_867765 [Lasiosphaeria miniovina]
MLSSPARTLQIAVASALLCSAARTHTVPSVKVPASAIGAGGWASLCPVRVPVRSGHLRAPTPASGQGMPRWPEGSSDGSARVGALSVQPEGQHFTRVGADQNGVPQRAEDGRSWWMWQFSAARWCMFSLLLCPLLEASWKDFGRRRREAGKRRIVSAALAQPSPRPAMPTSQTRARRTSNTEAIASSSVALARDCTRGKRFLALDVHADKGERNGNSALTLYPSSRFGPRGGSVLDTTTKTTVVTTATCPPGTG